MSTRIFICGHPRSGNHWYENQLRLLLYKRRNKTLTVPQLHKKIVWTMLGYQAEGFNRDACLAPPPIDAMTGTNGVVTFILREAKAVITSFFYYINFTMANRMPVSLWKTGKNNVPQNIEKFVRSPWGVSRYCRYLNELSSFWRTTKTTPRLFFYEDLGKEEIIADLPKSLGWSDRLKPEEIQFIKRNTDFSRLKSGLVDDELKTGFKDFVRKATDISKDGRIGVYRFGILDSYKKEIMNETSAYIDKYLKKKCRMPEYRERYLAS